MTRRLVVLSAALLLAGCMVGPDYKRPDYGLPAHYGGAGPASGSIEVPQQWWTLYGDATLDDLVKSGLERNADVRLAAARVEESEAVLAQVRAAFFPIIEGQAGATRSRTLQFGTANNFSLGLSTSFELDVWGRLRRAERSVRDDLLASRYGQDTVALTLAATIARTYFTALSLDTQYAASAESLKAANDSYDLAKRRLSGGVGSALDVYQAGALVTAGGAQLKEIARQRSLVQHQLGVLTGRLDVAVAAKDINALPIPPLPPAGLPSELLERRPDVRQAEAELASATERIGVARAGQFPALTLTGSFGVQSRDLDQLFSTGSRVWSFGAGLLGPVIDAGLYAARTKQAEAQAHQAQAGYQRAVENAFRDVSDALSNVQAAADTEKDLASRLEQAREALRLADMRYRSGYSAYLEVLDATRTLNSAQLDYIRNRQNYLSYTVDLMNSLGGGWTPSAGEGDNSGAAAKSRG
jgi:multidrug efflux system outer membrane protein